MSLNDAQIIVLKIGTSLMSEPESFAPRHSWLQSLAADMAALTQQGKKLLVVSSGAVAFGRPILNLGSKALTLAEKQAASAAGQPHLIAAWQEALGAHGQKVAQILLTLHDSEERRRYLNARSTLEHLLQFHIIPIVNENDTVATAELRFGDNDRLAARVAAMVGADALVLFSDVDGLYSKHPSETGAQHLPRVEHITPEIEAMAGGAASAAASGGMVTKLSAASIATSSGCHTFIAKGLGNNPLAALLNGARHTHFVAHETPLLARKHWIKNALHLPGEVRVDAGAADALREGKSLLPAGIVEVRGHFDRGDTIGIRTREGTLLGKGLTAYDAEEAQKIAGRKTHEIASVLGYEGREPVIHRDDMVLE